MKRFFLLIAILFSLLFVNLNAIEKTYKDKKFYDQNKNDSLNQKSACWAASTANILKAWQDYLNKFYYTSPPLGTPSTLNEIYERVYSFGYLKSQKIKAEANSTVNGIAWFIAGISYDMETNSIEKSKSGGFYKDLYKGISSPADLVTMHKVVDANMSLKGLETIFENSLKKDSKISISLSSDDGGSNHGDLQQSGRHLQPLPESLWLCHLRGAGGGWGQHQRKLPLCCGRPEYSGHRHRQGGAGRRQ